MGLFDELRCELGLPTCMLLKFMKTCRGRLSLNDDAALLGSPYTMLSCRSVRFLACAISGFSQQHVS
jgi:hypothetical protein